MQLEEAVEGLPPTAFHYWTDSYASKQPAVILRAIREDKRDVYLTLNGTIFHPKSGGQPSDRGRIIGDGFKIQVKKSMLVGKHIVHWGKTEGEPALGAVIQEIDWQWRYLLMRRHTAAHLFDHCLSQAVGREVETKDSWLGDPCYAGYRGLAPSSEIIEESARLENQMIQRGLTVKAETISRASLVELAAKAPNLRRLPELDEYRIVTIEDYTSIPCGGTHLRNASEISGFKVVKTEQLGDSFRIYFAVL